MVVVVVGTKQSSRQCGVCVAVPGPAHSYTVPTTTNIINCHHRHCCMTVHDSLDGVEITNNYTSNAPHHHQHYCHCSGKINLFNLYPFVQLCLAVQFFSYMFLRGKTKHLK